MNRPIFIAHRGAPNTGRRENSLAAFERSAASKRFSYIELDVRRTRTDDDQERVPIVAHDARTDALYDLQRIPMSKRTYQGVRIASLTHAMLREDSLEITTLRDAIRAIDGHPVNIEIKDIAALDETLEVVEDFVAQSSSKWKFEHFVISSFDWQVLVETRQRLPDVGIGLLYGFRSLPSRPFKAIAKIKPRFVMFNKWLAPIIAPLLKWHRINSRYAFTVNNKYEAKFLQLFGVNGFTTDSVNLPDSF